MDEISFSQAVQTAQAWGAPAPLAPLILNYDVCETHENIERNIRQTLESSYTPINDLLSIAHDGELSVVGFGPSIHDVWRQIKGDVWACNGAHDWLIERGVIPKYAMFWDASPLVAKFVNPHPDVTYIVASRCHRDVFEALDGFNVRVWHAAGDRNIEELLCEYRRMEPLIGHGSAAVTTGMMVSLVLGYRNFHLFGCDSSYSGETTHARKSIVDETPIEVWVDGRMFKSTTWLAGQVEDFKTLAPLLKDAGCKLDFYGFGMLQWVAHIHGYDVHL